MNNHRNFNLSSAEAASAEPVSLERVRALLADGRVVFPYPRLRMVSINGFPRVPATRAAIAAAVAARKVLS